LAESSPQTTSTGCDTSVAPTDKESIIEEPDDKDRDKREDEEEGSTGKGEGGAEEEEVGRDKEDITNLTKSRKSKHSRRTRDYSGLRANSREVAHCLDTFGTTIYSFKGPWETKHHNDLNR